MRPVLHRHRRAACLGAAMMLLAPGALAQPPDSTTATARPDEYRIGIADELRISVWREEDVSLRVIVRPDGKITVPLVGDIHAAGRTATDITQQIAQALTKYIKEPIVTVIVEEINSNTVYVLGDNYNILDGKLIIGNVQGEDNAKIFISSYDLLEVLKEYEKNHRMGYHNTIGLHRRALKVIDKATK